MTGPLLQRIAAWAARRPRALALADAAGSLDYAALQAALADLDGRLGARRVGLLLDNGIPWALLDLALLRQDAVCVPMPGFFSDAQLGHLIADADLDLVVTDQPQRAQALLPDRVLEGLRVAGRRLWLLRRRPHGVRLPAGTAKVTYTSGSTGQPKGVCLAAGVMQRVAQALCQAVGASPLDRALSLLPLATLLENIGGLYAPLMAGALAQLPPLADCGLHGSSGLDPQRLAAALGRYRPSTLILVPQLLAALTELAAAGLVAPGSLRFVAVGGAPLAADLLQRARAAGLPVYQGYGLSEATSVVCLNRPGADRPQSVGRPLPHCRVSIAADGEVQVAGSGFLGYLGGAQPAPGPWATGDLGHLDADGYLYLEGRRKTVYATAYGRNLAPEWVEAALCAHPRIAQAAVFGAGRPYNVAVLVPRGAVAGHGMEAAVQQVNAGLPDYARIARWLPAGHPFTPDNGLATGAGALRRAAVAERYREPIETLYAREDRHVVVC